MNDVYYNYMNELKKALKHFDSEFAADILEDFENHFAAGRSNGLTDEEICTELGPVEDVITAINQEFQTEESERKNIENDAVCSKPEKADKRNQIIPVNTITESAAVKKMIIRLKNASVTFLPGKTDTVEYEYSGKNPEERYDIYTEGETFYLVERPGLFSGRQIFQGMFFSDRFEIHVPASVEQLELSSTNGSCLIEELQCQHISIKDCNGSIEIQRTRGKDCRISNTNGSIRLEQLDFHEVDAHTTNGRVEVCISRCTQLKVGSTNGRVLFDENTTEKMEASTVNGGIQLRFHRPKHGVSLHLSTVCGKLTAILNGQELKAKKRLEKTYGEGGLQIHASSVNGGISVEEI